MEESYLLLDPGLLVLLYQSVLSALAFSLWTQLLKYHPVRKIRVFTCIVPIAGTLLSALILGEDIMPIKYPISLLLVTPGIYAINRKRRPGSIWKYCPAKTKWV